MKTLTASEISQRLTDRVESCCRWLLPNGKLKSGEWCVGSVAGEAGDSCKVRVTGERAGAWADFAGDGRGDLLDLICHTRGCGMGEAVKIAKNWLGIVDPENVVPARKYRKPAKTPPRAVSAPGQAAPVDEAIQYLTQTRKLNPETVKKFGVYGAGRDIVFPSMSPEGELVSLKWIGLDRTPEGKKRIRQEEGCAPSLFGWQAMHPSERYCVITEGQIDAMSWASLGWQALSVPNGTGDCEKWIEYEWPNLERFDSIYLCFDMDAPGREAVAKVAKRLGVHRCMDVRLAGHKDANDALVAGKGVEWFQAALQSSGTFKPAEIISPTDIRDQVLAELFPDPNAPKAFFPATLGSKIALDRGELTIWTGINGHGKSTILFQVALEAAAAGMPVAVASMEMPARKMLAQAVRLCGDPAWKLDDLDQARANIVLESLVGRLWIFNVCGTMPMMKLKELMSYSVARFGVQLFIVDSMMKLDVGVDDFDAQRLAVNELKGFAEEHQVQVHLVCHPRKQKDETVPVGKLDVSGSGDITNGADNILSIWRNKAKEKKREENSLTDSEEDSVPDTVCYQHKARWAGDEHTVPMWFNRKRKRFVTLSKIQAAGGKQMPVVPNLRTVPAQIDEAT
jgi:twinkle protein